MLATLLGPTVHHVVNPWDALRVDVGQRQIHPQFLAPRHGFGAIAIKGRLIQVGVGVYEVHGGAKIAVGLPLRRG